MMAVIRTFIRATGGATAIEYGLIAGMIALVIINVLSSTGTKLNSKFSRISNALN